MKRFLALAAPSRATASGVLGNNTPRAHPTAFRPVRPLISNQPTTFRRLSAVQNCAHLARPVFHQGICTMPLSTAFTQTAKIGWAASPPPLVGDRPEPWCRMPHAASVSIFFRRCNLVHRHLGKIACKSKHLDGPCGRARRLRKVGLRIDGPQLRPDHRDASCSGRRDLRTGRKCRQPGIGNFRFPGSPPKALDPGVAHTLPLGA